MNDKYSKVGQIQAFKIETTLIIITKVSIYRLFNTMELKDRRSDVKKMLKILNAGVMSITRCATLLDDAQVVRWSGVEGQTL